MNLSTSSLTGQLNRSLLALVCGGWLLGAMAVVWFVNHEVAQHLDESLVHSANRLLELAVHEMTEADLPGVVSADAWRLAPIQNGRNEVAAVPSRGFLVYQVVDSAHRIQLRSQDAPAQAFDVSLRPGFEQTARWRVYTLRHPVQPLFIHVADALAEREHVRNQTAVLLLLPLFLALPALVYGVQKMVNQRMRVVDGFAAQLAQRNGNDLSALNGLGLPDEWLPLAGNVNRLLGRLEVALNTERALSANAAHELRTPLTVMQLRMANALAGALPTAARQELESVKSALQTLQRRAEKLLQLSHAESSASTARAPMSLNAVIAAVVQEFEDSTQTQQRLRIEWVGDEMILGDFDTVAIALRNLIENGLRYGGQAPVVVGTLVPGILYVRDQGPGVEPDQLNALLERHVRFAADEAGFGLGLSIVKSIVERHQGRLELRSPPEGFPHGFEARLYFLTPRPQSFG